jgi:hypothetical protein
LLKRGDLIESDKTLEEHEGEIDAAPIAPPLADPGKPAVPGTPPSGKPDA